jgi:hypothetical protein
MIEYGREERMYFDRFHIGAPVVAIEAEECCCDAVDQAWAATC